MSGRLLLLCLWSIACAFQKPSFLLTAPKVLNAGERVSLVFTAFGVSQHGTVTVGLLAGNGTVSVGTTATVPKGSSATLQLQIPQNQWREAYLQANGAFGSYRFHTNTSIKVVDVSESFVTILQTDKPVYKPGQLVRFRILLVNKMGFPLTDENTTGEVWVENPSHLRVSQWKNVSFTEGVVQLSMHLSTEPPLGEWKLFSLILGQETLQGFQVDHYILPRFEVKIFPPAFILPENMVTNWTICARYSYGKPVRGQLRATITYRRYGWHSEMSQILPSIRHETPIIGCHDIEVDGKKLMLATTNRRELNATAEVTEDGTSVTLAATELVKLSWSRIKLEFIKQGEVQSFKPGLPYEGWLKVTLPNGKAAPLQTVRICFDVSDDTFIRGCRTFKSDDRGLVFFTLPAVQTKSSINLKATTERADEPWRGRVSPSRASIHLSPWHSDSDSHVQLLGLETPLVCNSATSIKFRYTLSNKVPEPSFHYQVVSGGSIVGESSFVPQPFSDIISKEIPVATSSRVPPAFASGQFNFSPQKGVLGGGSIVLYYVHPSREVVADARLYEVDDCANNKVSLAFVESSAKPGTPVHLVLSAAHGSLCAITVVDKRVHILNPSSGLTQATLKSILNSLGAKPDMEYIKKGRCSNLWPSGMFNFGTATHHLDSAAAFEEAGMTVLTDMDLDTRPCTWRAAIPLAAGAEDLAPGLHPPFQEDIPSALNVRSQFPEEWLWELHRVQGDKVDTLQWELPHTVTQWEASAVCLSRTHGVAVTQSPATVRGFQPFFLQLTMPYSAVRGEELNLVTSIFNYFPHSCLPLKVSLEINAQEVHIINRRSYELCVCGGESASVTFRITPVHLGQKNLTVHAFWHEASKKLCPENVTVDNRKLPTIESVHHTLLVKAEGWEKEFSMSKYVCVSRDEDDLNAETFFLAPPEDMINGSARAFFSASGDILSSTLAGLEKLVRLPVGCGEQNIILLAPNVFVLDYLESTKQLKPHLKERLVGNILAGYQRELNYRHPDGGYSAFGKMDPEPSLWLTAFVVRTFGGARHFVPIDRRDFDSSVTWLLKQQQQEDGCFPSVGTVLNSKIKGGLREGSLVPVTAYVLISLLEAGTESPETYTNAAACLLAKQPSDSYTLALATYALTLLQHPNAYQLLDVLHSRATITGDKSHWQEDGTSTGTAVETAAYIILATLKAYNVSAVSRLLPVVRWVLEQQNPRGGFLSTQDTVVALQALTQYAKVVLSTRPGEISLQVKTDRDFLSSLRIHKENRLLQQEIKLPHPPFVLTIEANGTGCAFIQSTLRYNALSMRTSTQFDLSVLVSEGDCARPKVTLCGRYLIPGSSSGMVTIEASLVSGYAADLEGLNSLLDTNQVKRYEVDQDQVNLYFDNMRETEVCVTFALLREYTVENAAPAVVLLRDYYDPNEFDAKMYSIGPCNKDSGEETILGRGQPPLELHGRLDAFKDVDFELEFPEGPEANGVVAVPPGEEPHSYDLQPCPTCWTSVPPNFGHLYCKSASVLRVQLLRAAQRKVDVTHNVSPHLRRRLPVGDVAVHTLSRDCSCHPLTTDSKPRNVLLVMGDRNMLSTTRLGMISLKVTGRTTVVSFPDEESQAATLKAARNECPL